jgi:DNA-directed RNA polymerase subunit M/transcription elongation factor TFIIS
MPLFCKFCSNLLVNINSSDSLKFKCVKCNVYEEPTDEDTLRYEDVKAINLDVYKSIVSTAADDPVNPKVKKICPKCKHDRARQVRIGDELKLINKCIKCKEQWVEGTS